jgi:hypothetical protein
MVVQQSTQPMRTRPPGSAMLVFEDQHAFFGLLVEAAVADEMEHVILAAAQPALQRGQRGVLQTVDLELAAANQRARDSLSIASSRATSSGRSRDPADSRSSPAREAAAALRRA